MVHLFKIYAKKYGHQSQKSKFTRAKFKVKRDHPAIVKVRPD